jgi:hypothetical protein
MNNMRKTVIVLVLCHRPERASSLIVDVMLDATAHQEETGVNSVRWCCRQHTSLYRQALARGRSPPHFPQHARMTDVIRKNCFGLVVKGGRLDKSSRMGSRIQAPRSHLPPASMPDDDV